MSMFKKSLFFSCFMLASGTAFAMQGGASWDAGEGSSGTTKGISHKFGFSFQVDETDHMTGFTNIIKEKIEEMYGPDKDVQYNYTPSYTMLGFEIIPQNPHFLKLSDQFFEQQKYTSIKEEIKNKFQKEVHDLPAGWTLGKSYFKDGQLHLEFKGFDVIRATFKDIQKDAAHFLSRKKQGRDKPETWKEFNLLPFDTGMDVARITPEDKGQEIAESLNNFISGSRDADDPLIFRVSFSGQPDFKKLEEPPLFDLSPPAPIVVSSIMTRQRSRSGQVPLPAAVSAVDQNQISMQQQRYFVQQQLVQRIQLAQQMKAVQRMQFAQHVYLAQEQQRLAAERMQFEQQQLRQKTVTRQISAAQGSAGTSFDALAALTDYTQKSVSFAQPVATTHPLPASGKGKRSSAQETHGGKKAKQASSAAGSATSTKETEVGFTRSYAKAAPAAPRRPQPSLTVATKPMATVSGIKMETASSPGTPNPLVIDFGTLSPQDIKPTIIGRKKSPEHYISYEEISADESADEDTTTYQHAGKPRAQRHVAAKPTPQKRNEAGGARRFEKPSGLGIGKNMKM